MVRNQLEEAYKKFNIFGYLGRLEKSKKKKNKNSQ